MNGSCFGVQDGSRLIVTNSSFIHNVAAFCGGAIWAEPMTDLVFKGAYFGNNSVRYVVGTHGRHAHPGGGAVRGGPGVTLTSNDTIFENNSCINSAQLYPRSMSNMTATHLVYDLVSVKPVFRAANGGAISLANSVSVILKNTSFKSNFAHFGGASMNIGGNSTLIMETTFLSTNKGSSGSGVVSVLGDFTNVTATHCRFHNNFGVFNVGIAFGGARIQLDNCVFDRNSGKAVISSSQETEYEQDQYAQRQLCLIFVRNSSFITNDAKAVFDIFSSFLRVSQCKFDRNKNIVFHLLQKSGLRLEHSILTRNSRRNTAVVLCEGYQHIFLLDSLFQSNEPISTLFWFESSGVTVVKNCTFLNHTRGVFISFATLTLKVITCLFEFAESGTTEVNNALVSSTNYSQITFVDTTCTIPSVRSILIVGEKYSNITVANSLLDGYVIFQLDNSLLVVQNCSFNSTGTDQILLSQKGQILLTDSSTLKLIDSKIYWNSIHLVTSKKGSKVDISGCTFQIYSQTAQFLVTDGHATIKKCHITTTPPNPLIYAHQQFVGTVPHVIEVYNSFIELVGVKLHVRKVRRWPGLKLESSNATLSGCFFESRVNFLDGARNYILVQNSVILDGGIGIFSDVLDVILIGSSAALEFFTDCDNPINTLRIANSKIFVTKPLPLMERLLTWKSVVNFDDLSHNTSQEYFAKNAAKGGLLNYSLCHNTIHKRSFGNSVFKIYETKYAVGKKL